MRFERRKIVKFQKRKHWEVLSFLLNRETALITVLMLN